MTERLEDFDTGSHHALTLMGEWFCACINSHAACKQYQKALPALPSRVIDVGPSDGPRDPRLLTSNGERGYYFTLSHRWGDYTMTQTTRQKLETRSKLIPLRSFPATFQDAIDVTRKLGVKFLWIDTICIIQDDAADWEREAVNMSQIYRRSMLTIAASAEDCHEHGLLRKRIQYATGRNLFR